MRWLLICVSLLACDAGAKKPKPESKREPAPPPAAPTPVTLPAGEIHLGCIGWSPEMRAVFCVLGETEVPDKVDAELTFVGGDLASIPIGGALEPEAAANVNAILASHHFVPLPPATALVPGTAADHLYWRRTETAPASEVSPAAHFNAISIICTYPPPIDLMSDNSPGDNPTATYRKLGDITLVELDVPRALEGEYGTRHYAEVVNAATCPDNPRRR